MQRQAELSPTEVAEHLARRKELWAQRKERDSDESGNTVSTFEAGGRGNKAFAQETAEATGITKQAVNKSLSRASAIPEDMREKVRGTRLDTAHNLATGFTWALEE